jgi:hypothetical protein
LADKGYNRQICTDFSTVVVKTMTERHQQYPGIEWRALDVRDMQGIADKSVTVAFEKSMLDVMIYGSPWNPPDEVKENARQYMKEVGYSSGLTARFRIELRCMLWKCAVC